MRLSEFDYHLPSALIAQKPVFPRSFSRLLVLDRKKKKIFHSRFFRLREFLQKGDVLVLNNSRVIPARLFGQKDTGGKTELLLLKKKNKYWEVLLKGRIREKNCLAFGRGKKKFCFFPLKKTSFGTWLGQFDISDSLLEKRLKLYGIAPTPPYIKRLSNLKEYQTVYAKIPGSVAAPTAGFHFTNNLIRSLKKKGIRFFFITLHINFGTFAPIKEEIIEKHKMYSEWAQIKKETAYQLNKFKKKGKRIIAVGTSSCRTLEAFANKKGILKPGIAEIDLFIYPGYRFRFIDGMITNFHLPKSTPLLLVCALAGKEMIFKAYQEAIEKRYRFYSFGDAMLII